MAGTFSVGCWTAQIFGGTSQESLTGSGQSRHPAGAAARTLANAPVHLPRGSGDDLLPFGQTSVSQP